MSCVVQLVVTHVKTWSGPENFFFFKLGFKPLNYMA